MELLWTFETLSVSVAEVDFVDPSRRDEPDVRERGVRLEVRPTRHRRDGSAYVSASTEVAPGVCRIDLLESRPLAADRMHWHPVMHDGEPGRRTFDEAIPADPEGWLRDRLRDLPSLLAGLDAASAAHHLEDAAELAARADEIVAAVRSALARTRQPWPDVAHDERGMAVA
jgi:hypothetical protein